MSKSKKKHAVPNIPAAALLRPRLDALWNNPALPQQTDAEIQTALDELARGVKSDFLLPTLIRAYRSAPASARSRVDAWLPNWLSARSHRRVNGVDRQRSASCRIARAGKRVAENQRRESY